MSDEQITVRPSKSQFIFLTLLGLSMLIFATVSLNAFIHDSAPLTSVIILGGFAVLALYTAFSRHSRRLILENGSLTARWPMGYQKSVNLTSLKKAEQYSVWSKSGYTPIIRLVDTYNTLKIFPKDYEPSDTRKLMSYLKPYVIQDGIERNFTDFSIAIEDRIASEPISISKTFKGLLMYILLPAILITAIIVSIAILTN